jgi:hypothetical protein
MAALWEREQGMSPGQSDPNGNDRGRVLHTAYLASLLVVHDGWGMYKGDLVCVE